MSGSEPERRPLAGLLFSLTTVATWGVIPLTLEQLLNSLQVRTIVWWRFVISAAVLAAVLAATRRLPRLGALGRTEWLLLAVASVGLVGNYFGFTAGLELTTPGNAQVLIQLAPFLLALGGIALFGERLSRRQWFGYVVLVIGQAVFLGGKLRSLAMGLEQYLWGIVVLVIGAIAWAGYALAQKRLLQTMPAQACVLCIYVGCLLLVLPVANPAAVRVLDGVEVGLLAAAGLGTLVGYGAFSEALRVWEASRVGAVISLTPLATLVAGHVAASIWPNEVTAEPLAWPTAFGALAVVAGSMLASLGARRVR